MKYPHFARWLGAWTALLVLSVSVQGQGASGRAPRPAALDLAHPAVAAVAQLQDRHTPALLGIPGVVGTATGLSADGQLVIKVLLEVPGVPGLPAFLDGVAVEPKVTGMFKARVDPTERFARPVPIGVSVGHPLITAGTLGCRVWRLDASGEVFHFILSNNHVLANSNNAQFGDPSLQPGPFDGGTADDEIAVLFDFEPIRFDGSNNQMDAAIAWTTETDTGYATPVGAGAYGAPSSTTFAPSLNLPVQKYGRTTRLTQGQISSINATVTVCYEVAQRGPFLRCVKQAQFTGQILIQPGSFSAGGDSGSLIVTADGNNPVALLFAGSDTHTIATPIDLVLNRFGVLIDDGTGGVGKGTVSGTVKDSNSSTGISGAIVRVEGTGQQTSTDGSGAYTLENVPARAHSLTASAEGYDPQTLSTDVSAGNTTVLGFTLSPLATGWVAGTVTDIDGDPIAGATVAADTGQFTATDASGNYTLEAYSGARTLTASAPGHASESWLVEVLDGPTVQEIHFRLHPAIVVPNAFAEVEALGYGGTLNTVLRVQQVYDKRHFGSGPVQISALAFRVDNGFQSSSLATETGPPFGGAGTNQVTRAAAVAGPSAGRNPAAPAATATVQLRIDLSTTSKAADGLSLTFANNLGTDTRRVFEGSLEIQAAGGAPAGSPNAFEIVVPFTQAFTYDPSRGNLLVDLRNDSGGNVPNNDGSNAPWYNQPDDFASRAFVVGNPDASQASHTDTGADVLRFLVTRVNQPPVADFSFAVSDKIVTFKDASEDPDGTITAWLWNFGDGSTAVDQNPKHDYTQYGTYSVTLTVTDDKGATGSVTKEVVVPDPNATTPTMTATLTGQAATVNRNFWNATVTVTVTAGQSAVSGAVVTGAWSGGVSSNVSNQTGADGQISFTSPNIRSNQSSVTFTLSNVSHPQYAYEPGGLEPITLTRP